MNGHLYRIYAMNTSKEKDGLYRPAILYRKYTIKKTDLQTFSQ